MVDSVQREAQRPASVWRAKAATALVHSMDSCPIIGAHKCRIFRSRLGWMRARLDEDSAG
eukprot:365592-Chlamydomonas_euryale.AAC.17